MTSSWVVVSFLSTLCRESYSSAGQYIYTAREFHKRRGYSTGTWQSVWIYTSNSNLLRTPTKTDFVDFAYPVGIIDMVRCSPLYSELCYLHIIVFTLPMHGECAGSIIEVTCLLTKVGCSWSIILRTHAELLWLTLRLCSLGVHSNITMQSYNIRMFS